MKFIKEGKVVIVKDELSSIEFTGGELDNFLQFLVDSGTLRLYASKITSTIVLDSSDVISTMER